MLEEAGDPPLCSSADPIRTDDGSLLLAVIVVAIAVQKDRARMRRAVAIVTLFLLIIDSQSVCCMLFARRLFVTVILHAYVGAEDLVVPRQPMHFLERRRSASLEN